MDKCNTSFTFTTNDTYCDWIFDGITCWAPTEADSSVEIPCPKMKGSDPSKTVSKYCEKDGHWDNETDTNYSSCLTEEVLSLIEQLRTVPLQEVKMKFAIAEMIRILEIIGLTASLVILCLSFTVYSLFRSLRNDRTRIHINLFIAVMGTVLMKLVICIDYIFNAADGPLPTNIGVEGTPYICETTYVILEYCKSSTYMWMFIEALHLHNAIAVTATQMSFKRSYLFLGWGVSAIFVTIWVIVMSSKPRGHCWWAYNYNPIYWILEGPRISILVVNTVYLLIIIRVVFIKLRSNVSNELDKIRKTTKATLVLLPLLGITNYLSHIEPKLTCPLWYFILYSLSSYFLNSFQGMVIGLLYCLLNKEVKETILSKITISFNSGTNSPNEQNNINRRREYHMHSLENGVLP